MWKAECQMCCVIHMHVSVRDVKCYERDVYFTGVCGTLLVAEALWRLSCDLLLVKEDLQLRSLCLCLHSRQFLTATQHTDGDRGRADPCKYHI